MPHVHVDLKRIIDDSYDLVIEAGVRNILAQDLMSLIPSRKYVLITDANLYTLFGQELEALWISQGLPLITKIIPSGENSKSREVKAEIEDWMIQEKVLRDGCIIALGGGVIGDLAGFVAATYMRGIPWIQIPTSFLAMVDASIGGKTAINIPSGKNLIGSFHQPKRVYIDTDFLQKLPEREIRAGLAEVIKIAITSDKQLFHILETEKAKILAKNPNALTQIIVHNSSNKAHITSQDEKETGLRMILNFGHTIGHAIEKLCEFTLNHGECVAIGMIYESRLASSLGYLSQDNLEQIENIITSYGLPTKIPDTIDLASIIEKTLIDKKSQTHLARYVMIEHIGKVKMNARSYVHEIDSAQVWKILS